MAKRDDLEHFTRVRPFRPFEIHTTSGEKYGIHSPEILISESMTVFLDRGQFRFLYLDSIESISG